MYEQYLSNRCRVSSLKNGILILVLIQYLVKSECIEDSYRKRVVIDDEAMLLDILDTCSVEEYAAMRDTYIKQAHGFILVYSVTRRDSFLELQHFIDQILSLKVKRRVNSANLQGRRWYSHLLQQDRSS